MFGFAAGGIAMFSRSMSAGVVPVKFWNPGMMPARDAGEQDRHEVGPCRLSGPARFGNTPGYRTGSSFASSGLLRRT